MKVKLVNESFTKRTLTFRNSIRRKDEKNTLCKILAKGRLYFGSFHELRASDRKRAGADMAGNAERKGIAVRYGDIRE